MAAMAPKSHPVEKHVAGDQEEADTEVEAAAAASAVVGPDVTRHILLKSSQALDKAVVLRRIRHRKRVNKFKAVVGALFSSDSGHTKWVDEPFTSL